MSALADAWGRVTTWLTVHAPATAAALRPGAGAGDVDALAADLGLEPGDDLREWFRLQGGVGYADEGRLLPSLFMPLSAAESAATTRMMREVWADIGARDDEYAGPDAMQEAGDDPAGTGTGMWIPAFVAVADDCAGNLLFVDTRPGDLSGCVTGYVHGDADSFGPLAQDLSAYVADVGRALETGAPTRAGLVAFVPRVTDGVLDWDVDDAESRRREAAQDTGSAGAGELW